MDQTERRLMALATRRFKCDRIGCNKIYFTLRHLNRHKLTHFKPFKCTMCAKSFGTDWDRKIHQRIHDEDKREECTFCKRKFCDPAALRKHIKWNHNDKMALKPFVCRRCHRRFDRKFCLQSHIKMHLNASEGNKERFECAFCEKAFSNKSNRNKHVRKYHSL